MENKEIRIIGSVLFKRGLKNDLIVAFNGESEVLKAGEPAYEIDTKNIRIGDGSSAYENLPYVGGLTEIENFLKSIDNGTVAIDTLTEIVNKIETVKAELEGKIEDIDHEDYKAADEEIKASLNSSISTVSDRIEEVRLELLNSDTDLATSITNEYTRASGEENTIKGRVKTIEDDYLKTADKEEINGSIGAVSNVANNAKEAIDAFLKEADVTENAVNTLKEIQAELDAGEASAANLLNEINALKAIDNATQEELNTAVASLENKISVKSDASVVEEIAGRVTTLENAGHVNATQLETAKQEAITSANSTLTAKVNDINSRIASTNGALSDEILRATKAESDAKAYTDKVKKDLLGEGISETFDTLVEIQDWIGDHGVEATELSSAIAAEKTARQEADSTEKTERETAINDLRDELKLYFDTELGVIANGSY